MNQNLSDIEGKRPGAAAKSGQKLVRALAGEALTPPPVWLMRQAGRYLPEYRALREKAPDFLAFCYTPALAVEATLQPIHRFDLDAAIVFSDILVIPDALGQEVRFVEGEGPRLAPLDLGAGEPAAALCLEGLTGRLAPVYETLAAVRAALAADTALIGFCGAPWTLACYMLGGEVGADTWAARKLALTVPERFAALSELLVEACTAHLLAQAEAGANVLQIFDSWAGTLDEEGFRRWSIGPIAAIVARVRAARPDVPLIAFPRGAGAMLVPFAEETRADAVSVDWATPLAAARAIQARCAVQGNLDPARLVAGGAALDAAVDRILAALGDGPFVFNLGHGVAPETPVEHVARLVERVRGAA